MSEREGDRVLVIGGTRGAGLRIARLLCERRYRVRVLARDPARAAAELGPLFEVVAGDLTKPDTLSPAVRGADHIVFTAGVPSGRYASERLVKEPTIRASWIRSRRRARPASRAASCISTRSGSPRLRLRRP